MGKVQCLCILRVSVFVKVVVHCLGRRYSFKARKFTVGTWIEQTHHKIVSLTVQQWSAWGSLFAKDHPELIRQFRGIEKRWLNISDLLCQNGICPSLRFDHKQRDNMVIKYLAEHKLNTVGSRQFGHPQFITMMQYCAEREANVSNWVLTSRGVKELRRRYNNQWSIEEIEQFAAEIGLDVYADLWETEII